MKRIQKVVLKEAAVLNSEEMKHIFGGSGTDSGDSGYDDGCDDLEDRKPCSKTNIGSPCCYRKDGKKYIGTCVILMGYPTCFSK